MPSFIVDGVEYEAEEGRTLLQALDDAGVLMGDVEIPHYCWHPKLSIDGSCRLCQVEVEGVPKLQIACDTRVRDGMIVHTKNERVRTAREGVMELLLVNHPLDCPICDQAGECKLQDYAYDYGLAETRSREPRRALAKNVELGPEIVFDQERCILCRRCVRFCREVPETGELCVSDRGDRSTIETFPDAPLDNDYSMNVADICPVGALTTKDFRFKIRTWFLEEVEGICTGCAKGCNVYMGAAHNKVYRYVPRRNDEVNDTWLCDSGRLSYKRIAAPDRVQQPLVRGELGVPESCSVDDAIAVAAARLRALVDQKGAGVVAGIVSGHASNEDLFSFRRLLDALGTQSAGVAVVEGESDDLLREAEQAANGAGARALGFVDAATVAERIRNGGVDAVISLGHGILDPRYLGGTDALASLDTVIVLDAHVSALERVAHVLLPARVAAEKYATFTNHAGRVQRVSPALEPGFEAHPEGALLARLGVAMGLEGFTADWNAREVSRTLAATLPAFAGCDWEGVGAQGRALAEPGV